MLRTPGLAIQAQSDPKRLASRATHRLLRRLVDDVAGKAHIAFVLFAFPDDGPEQLTVIGRLIRYRRDPHCADVALTVADRWQRRGVRTALLAELVRQRLLRIGSLLTHVSTENLGSIAMLRHLGAMQTAPAGPGVREIRVSLRSLPSHGASAR